jgi:hypothetical protein
VPIFSPTLKFPIWRIQRHPDLFRLLLPEISDASEQRLWGITAEGWIGLSQPPEFTRKRGGQKETIPSKLFLPSRKSDPEAACVPQYLELAKGFEPPTL